MAGAAVRMHGLYVAAVTGRTVTSLETRLQVRNADCVTEAAITTMGNLHRRIGCRTRIVAIRTRAGQGNQSGCVVGASVSRRLVRMTIEAVGRGTCCDDVDDRLRRAVVTG